jgi:hypothetical protein
VSGLRRSLRVPFVLLPLVLLAAVSGCGSVASGSTAEAAGGTVANPTGSIKGQTLTGLVDAYTGNWGGLNGTSSATTTQVGTAKAQWQHAVLLSDHTGACDREGSGGGYAGNEVAVRLTMIGFADLTSPPATPGSIATIPSTPLTFTANVWQPPLSTPGEHRVINPYYMKTRSNGRATRDTAATGGTITFTQMDATSYAGSYDLYFGTDHMTGSFLAPWC